MPGEQLIGRVAVKVLPDTSDFRRRAKAQLDAIEKGLEITVGAKLDTTGLRRDMLQEIRKINAENRATDSRKIKFYATVDGSSAQMREQLTKALRKMQADADGRRLVIKTDIVAAVSELRLNEASLKQVENDIKDWRDRVSPILVDVKPNFVQGSGTLISARLAVLTRPRTVSIIPTLNNGAYAQVATALAALSGARFLSSVFEDITRSLLKLDKNLPIIGTIALAVAGLSGWATAATSNLFALSSALAQIGPAALALPGIFGGLAIGLATSVVAFRDFNTYVPQAKEQLLALGDTISSNFWEGAAEPINRFVNVLLPQVVDGVANTATILGTYWGNLATSLTGAFDGVLASMFADLNESIAIAGGGTDALAGIIAKLGAVGAGYLPQLAGWFVDITTQFDNFLARASASGELQIWIDTAIAQLNALGSSFASIGGILADIGRAATNAGGSTLQMFADTLNQIQAVTGSPAFQQGLTAVFAAAHQAMSLIASTSGPAVERLFVELGQVLQTILPIAGSAIGSLLSTLATALTQVEVPAGLVMAFDGLRIGIEALAPAAAPLGQALGAILTLIGTLAQAFGPLLGAAISIFATAIAAIAPALGQVVTLLASGLTAALQVLGPLLVQGAQALSGFISQGGSGFSVLATAVGGLLPILTMLGQQLVGIIGPVFAALAPVVGALAAALGIVLQAVLPLASALLSLVGAVLVPLAQIIGSVLTAALPKLAAAFAGVVAALMPVIQAVTALINFLMPVLVPVLTFLANLIVGAVIGALNGLATAITGVVQFFVGLWNIVAGLFTGNWAQLWEGVKGVAVGVWNFLKGAFEIFMNVGILRIASVGLGLIKGLFTAGWGAVKALSLAAWNALKAAWSAFLNALKSSPGAALNAIKSLFSAAWNAIRSATSAAWTAIQTAIRTAMAFIGTVISTYISMYRTLISTGMNAIRAAFTAAWNTIRALVTTAWSGITSAVSSGISRMMGLITAIPGKIRGALGNLGGLLIGAGRSLIEGLASGITGALGGLLGKVRDMAGKIASTVKDALKINSPSKVMIPIGAGVPEGLAVGIERNFGQVFKTFDGLADELSSREIELGMKDINKAELGKQLANLSTESEGTVIKQLNYYAADGSSFSTEEDFFAATDRARAGW